MLKLVQRESNRIGARRTRASNALRVKAMPQCETLELRRLLTSQSWLGGSGPAWSTAANWSSGPISPSDLLIFPATGAVKTTTNDTGAGNPYTLLFSSPDYILNGQSIQTSGVSAVQDFDPSGVNRINLPLELPLSATYAVSSPLATLILNGDLSGSSSVTLVKDGSGTLLVNSSTNSFDGTTSVAQGTLEVDGNLGPISLNGGTLSGFGTVGTITASGGTSTLAPGTPTERGTLRSNTVVLGAGDRFVTNLDGSGPGEFDQLDVTGAVNLNNAELDVKLNFTPSATDSFVLINNDQSDPVIGTFNGLPQGSSLTIGNTKFIIDYYGGDGNDVVLNVDPQPIANPDFYTTPKDTTLFVYAPGVLGNDISPSGATLHPVVKSLPSHGSLTLNDDGSFNYVPSLGYSGPDSFTYAASTGTAESPATTVSLIVNPVNLPPVGNADSYTGEENTPLAVAAPGVLANDYSPEGLTLTAQVVAAPSQGSLVLKPDGSFVYIPNTGFTGTDSFTYNVTDSSGLTTGPTTVTLDVGPKDVVSTAVDDAFTLTENLPFFVAGPGVLTNDLNPSGSSLAAVLVASAQHGTLTLNPDGSFYYTPNANYSGTDSFQYEASDGILTSNVATVTLTITPVAVAPIAADDSYSMLENSTLTVAAPGVLLNDQNPGGGPLTITVVNGPLHASQFTLHPDGSLDYKAATNFFGTDSFSYYLTASGLNSNLATVTITVGRVPVAPTTSADLFTINENSTLIVAAPGVLANDSDPNGGLLSAFLQTGPLFGTVQLNSDGSFVYTPKPNYFGPDGFTYNVSNGELTSGITAVALVVVPVAVPPVTVDDAYTAAQDTTLNVAAPGVLANDTDPNGLGFKAVLINAPQHASSFTLNDDGSFTYVPALHYTGTDTFVYRAVTTLTGAESPLTTVTLTITPVPQAPVAVDDAYAVNQDTSLNLAAPGVLANDTDIDPNAVLHAVLQTGPTHGTVILHSDGSFVYTPDAFYNGTDSFTYLASDGQLTSNIATVTLTVRPVLVPPTTGNDAFTGLENQTLSIPAPGVLLNDQIPSSGPLAIIVVNAPLHAASFSLGIDGSLTYVPQANFFGVDTFTYYLRSNGLPSNMATVVLTIEKVAGTPVASDDSYATNQNVPLSVSAPGVLLNDVDPNGSPLSAVLQSGPLHGSVTLNSDGSFLYTPVADYFGVDSFTYVATNGTHNSSVATVALTVRQVFVAPVANNDSYSGLQNQTLDVAAPGVLLNDQNPSGGTLTITVVSNPLHASAFTLNQDGSFVYTPKTNFVGTDSFTYYLTSNGLNSNVATVTIAIARVESAPIANDDSYSTNQNTVLTVGAPGVLGNDYDPNGYKLSAVLKSNPSHGALVLRSDGSFVYTPAANYSGSDSFTYVANDGVFNSNVATVFLTIVHVAQAPTAGNSSYTMQAYDRLNVPAPGVLGNASDPQGLPLTAVLVNPTLNGVLSLNANGSFVYTPNAGFVGTDSFTFRASNGNLDSNLATATIHVTPIPPTTVRLDPMSDTGVSNTDRITRDTTPIFLGTTVPGLRVVLFAQLPGQATMPSVVGQTTADASGNYAVISSALSDGVFLFSVAAYRADGLSTGTVYAGPLTIDTVAPQIVNAVMVPKAGQLQITFQDDLSGMGQQSITTASNYSFMRRTTLAPHAYQITSATAIPPVSATSPETVVLTSSIGKRIVHGRYLFSAFSGGIIDVAGNPLDGYFNGTFPTGNGVAGSPFNAIFLNNGFTPNQAKATTPFFPVVSPGHRNAVWARSATAHAQSTSHAATPRGPRVHLARQTHAHHR